MATGALRARSHSCSNLEAEHKNAYAHLVSCAYFNPHPDPWKGAVHIQGGSLHFNETSLANPPGGMSKGLSPLILDPSKLMNKINCHITLLEK